MSQAYAFKVRTGKDTYIKPDGSVGTAGKGILMADDVAFTLATRQDQSILHENDDELIVRRLTPLECERLMAIPDGYTDLTGCDVTKVTEKVAAALGYDDEGKYKLMRKVSRWSDNCPNGPRYRCIGNSMAVNVMMLLGERIQMVQEVIDETEGADEAPDSYGEQNQEGGSNG